MSIVTLQCTSTVDPHSWDDLVLHHGGSFFHSHAYGLHESARPNVQPLFITAFNAAGASVGIAVGSVARPWMWPFSRFCGRAIFGALPATEQRDVSTQRAIVVAIEEALKRKGIFSIRFCSYESPFSVEVLSSLSYKLDGRCEFYIDLSLPTKNIWNNMKGARRTDIRKATRLGVETRMANSVADLQLLYALHAESMQRRGMNSRADIDQAATTKALLLDTGRAVLLLSYRDGIAVNAAMFGLFGEKAYYLNSGSSLVGNKSGGPVHLIWTMIELLKAEGISTLNLGGVASPSHGADSRNGLYSFKRDFGASVVLQPAGTKTICQFGAGMSWVLESLKRKAIY